jgi:serine/threonine-protein kinase
MPLQPGTTLGPYSVTAKIGEGGMGEVYRARDTKLDRDVALKVLPEAFTSDPDRLARFEREAKVLASLNHPNIGGIHGLEESDGVRALVLEYIEGPTLADRIAQGPIPLDEALPIAKQIAEALEAAHEAGVIHRDLKPANIKVRQDGTVKVLDFGLAKALDTTPEGDPSQSPTLTAAATQMGVILGTAAYMSPEQARGLPVDKRADVWAFGVVLYEMLTGRRPFQGEDVSLTLASVMKSDVNVTVLPADLPETLRTVIRQCLQKDPKRRIRDVGDVSLAMEGAFEATAAPIEGTTAPPLQFWQRPLPALAVLLTVASVASLSVWGLVLRNLTPSPEVVRFTIVPPETAPLDLPGTSEDVAISPNGTLVVYQGGGVDGRQLYLRPVGEPEATLLRGGAGAFGPFVSPDGQWVGFLDGPRSLKRVSVFGGPAESLTESPANVFGTSWGTDDQIVFGTTGAGLFRVPGQGGEAEALTVLDSDRGETAHVWPFIIPDREAVLFVISPGSTLSEGQLAVLDLRSGETKTLGLSGVRPHYVSTGHVVYAVVDGSLRAVPFDVTSLEVTGNPVLALEGVVAKDSGAANFSISHDGQLVYVSGNESSVGYQLAWLDHAGQQEVLDLPPRNYSNARLSPNGMQVLVRIGEETGEIWVSDVERNTLQRLDAGPDSETSGMWTVDGDRVVFTSPRGDGPGLFLRAADGTGDVEHLVTLDAGTALHLWSRPSRVGQFPFSYQPQSGGRDVAFLSLDGEPSWHPVFTMEATEAMATVSPDGRRIAYISNDTGNYEVYVQQFPDGGDRKRISTTGGVKPLWSPDGNALYYVDDRSVMVARVEVGPDTLRSEAPMLLFETNSPLQDNLRGIQDISPDGARFLAILVPGFSGETVPPSNIEVVLNWTKELQRLFPDQ